MIALQETGVGGWKYGWSGRKPRTAPRPPEEVNCDQLEVDTTVQLHGASAAAA